MTERIDGPVAGAAVAPGPAPGSAGPGPTTRPARSVYSTAHDTSAAIFEILAGLGDADPAAVLFFAAPAHDSQMITERLAERFPAVPMIGCTSSGEFDQERTGDGGVSVIALPKGAVRHAAAAVAGLDTGVENGVNAAVRSLEEQLGITIRDADPERYIGIVLMDGLNRHEESVNRILGNEAPLLSFVGGSAGDDLKFEETRVFAGTRSTTNGLALLLLETAVPYTIVKTCSYEPIGRTLTITEAEPAKRLVWRIDGRPAAEAYAEAMGRTVAELDAEAFAAHPLGLMIDGLPWIRCVQEVHEGTALRFACEVLEDTDMEVMHNTDLVEETTAAMRTAIAELGGEASGAVLFNCAYRKLEIEAKGLHQGFVDSLCRIPAAGFHTYGESWLGHMNCTLTGVVFG